MSSLGPKSAPTLADELATLSAAGEKWRIGAALGCAIVAHLVALLLGFLPYQQPHETIGAVFRGAVEVSMEMAAAVDEVMPPLDIDRSPVPPPLEDYLFTEPRNSPPPVRQDVSKPIARVRSGTSGSPSSSSARALALNAPWPEYPSTARQNKITGDGVAMMTIDSRGSVTHVSMWKSTGDPSLDDAALRSFRRWRFKPGSVSRVKAPVTFRLTAQLE